MASNNGIPSGFVEYTGETEPIDLEADARRRAETLKKFAWAETKNQNIPNAGGDSSATGLYQIVKPTFDLAKAKFPELRDIAYEDFKNDTNLQAQIADKLLEDNAKILRSKGIPTNDLNQYTMWFSGNTKLATAPRDAKAEDFLTPDQIAANKFVKGKTVGELRNYFDKKLNAGEIPAGYVEYIPEGYVEYEAPKTLAGRASDIIQKTISPITETIKTFASNEKVEQPKEGLSAEMAREQFKSGLTKMQQDWYINAAKNNANLLNTFDLVDQGKAVPEKDRDMAFDYSQMNKEQRAAFRDALQAAQTSATAKAIKYNQEQKGYARNPYADQFIQDLDDRDYSTAWQTFKKDPTGVVQQLAVESTPNQLPSLIAGASGYILRGGTAGLMVGLAGGSFPIEFMSSITDSLQDAGVDMSDDKAIEAKLRDPKFVEAAGQRALGRGTIIAAADAATGKLLSPLKAGQLGRNIARGAANVGVDVTGQMAGEAGAQAVSGEELKVGQIVAEGLGGGPHAVATTAIKTIGESAKKPEIKTEAKGEVKAEPTFRELTPEEEQAVNEKSAKEFANAPSIEVTGVGQVPPSSTQDTAAMMAELEGKAPQAPIEEPVVEEPKVEVKKKEPVAEAPTEEPPVEEGKAVNVKDFAPEDQQTIRSMEVEKNKIAREKKLFPEFLARQGIQPSEKADLGLEGISRPRIFRKNAPTFDELTSRAINEGFLVSTGDDVQDVENFREHVRDYIGSGIITTGPDTARDAQLRSIDDAIQEIVRKYEKPAFGLEATTPEQLKADEAKRQAEIDAQAKLDAEEKARQSREEIKRLGEKAAGEFELGKTAEEDLTGQKSVFEQPQGPKTMKALAAKTDQLREELRAMPREGKTDLELEAMDIADRIQSYGEKNFADGLRSAIRDGRIKTDKNLDFYRQREQEYAAQAGKSGQPVSEKLSMDSFMEGFENDQKRLREANELFATKTSELLDKTNEYLQELVDVVNRRGYKFLDIDTRSPFDVQDVRTKISQIAGSMNLVLKQTEAFRKGYDRANEKKLEDAVVALTKDFREADTIIDMSKQAEISKAEAEKRKTGAEDDDIPFFSVSTMGGKVTNQEMDKTHYAQRVGRGLSVVPEDMFYSKHNKGIEFGTAFQYAAEHIGDLVHRLSSTDENQGGGYKYGMEAALTKASRKYYFDDLIPQVDRNYEYHKKHGYEGSINDFRKEFFDAAKRYKEAYKQIPTYTELQELAKQAAISLGDLRFDDTQWLLNKIVKTLESKDAKEKYFERKQEVGSLAPSTKQTDTPAFKKWFGDSKVVDENDKPLLMYHGTADDLFNVFDKQKIRASDYDTPFNGFWFSSDKNTSPAMRDASNVIPVYLSIKNPAPSNVWRKVSQQVYDEFNSDKRDEALRKGARSVGDEIRYRLQDMGYDGIQYSGAPNVNKKELEEKGKTTFQKPSGSWYTLAENKEHGGLDLYGGKTTENHITGYSDINDYLDTEKEQVWVAFEPNQIKSATGNRGTFSAEESDIRLSKATMEQKKNAQLVADQFKGGSVVWQDGDLAIIRAFNLFGGVVYNVANGTRYWKTSIENAPAAALDEKDKARLIIARDNIEAQSMKDYKENPFIKFKEDIALSENISKEIAGIARDWKNLLGIDANIYIATLDDVRKNADKYTGPHREILSSTDGSNNGVMKKMSDGDYYIVLKDSTNKTKVLETLAHELGHIHEKEVFNNAPEEIRNSLREEHAKWLEKNKYKTAKEFAHLLRARTGAKTMNMNVLDGTLAKDIANFNSYWGSFSEWYADQVSRWAVSSEKPVTAIEKYFKKLADALRKFYLSIKSQKYLPNETFKKYLDEASKNLDIKPIIEEDGQLALFSKNEIKTNLKHKTIFGERALSTWTAPSGSKMSDLIYKLQDKHIDLKRVQQAITQQIESIEDNWNAYMKEELYHGRSAKRVEDYLEYELRPVIAMLNKSGLTLQEFDKFLHYRHAEERNNQIAKVNPLMPDGGSGVTTAEALEYLNNLSTVDFAVMDKLANKIDSMVRGTQDILVNNGLEDAKTINTWRKTYKHYVPLQRADLDFVHDVTGLGQGMGTHGKTVKRATGSTKEVVNVFANIAMQRERAIMRAEKARVGRALYGLAIKYPNADFWLPVNPDAIKDADGLARELQSLGLTQADAVNFVKEPTTPDIDPNTGLVVNRVNINSRYSDNVFPVRVNGKDRFIFFNPSNEEAMRLVKSIKNMDAEQLGIVLGNVGRVTRFIAAMNTQYNPVFGAWNFARDVSTGMLNLSTTPIAGQQAKVMAGVFPALAGIYRDLRSERKKRTPAEGKWADLWERFQNAGGQTGYRDQFAVIPKNEVQQLEAQEKTAKSLGNSMAKWLSRKTASANIIEREMNKLNQGNVRKIAGAFFGLLSDYNDAMENAVRLSAFKVALDKGLSEERAASLAKNLTVNFNRKGQLSTNMSALFAFFNPAVQSTARIAETLKGPAGRKIIAGGLLLGTMQALMLSMAGFDDDEPPEFLKDKNFIIPKSDGTYKIVPLPLGFSAIPAFSRRITEMVMSGEKIPQKMFGILGMLSDAFNPLGGGSFVQMISPTAVDPFVSVAMNKDAFGRPIYRDNRKGDSAPGHERSRENASTTSKYIAEFLNKSTGGTEYVAGSYSPTADELDYLAGQITGGLGREAQKAFETVKGAITGEEVEPHRKFVSSKITGDINTPQAISSKFYKNLLEMDQFEKEIKGRIRDDKDYDEFMENNPQASMWRYANRQENRISKINEQINKNVRIRDKADSSEEDKAEAKETIKELKERRTEIMKEFNDRMKEEKEEKR